MIPYRGRKPADVKTLKIRNEVYLDVNLAEILTDIARKKRIPKSEILKRAFLEYIQNHKDELGLK